MSVALLKVSYFHNKPRHPSSACSKELVQQWTMYVNNCNIWHLTKVLLLSSSNNMAACVCTCTCKNQKIFPSTESPTLTHTHTRTILVCWSWFEIFHSSHSWREILNNKYPANNECAAGCSCLGGIISNFLPMFHIPTPACRHSPSLQPNAGSYHFYLFFKSIYKSNIG